jgi:tetratricopeptide (TPR) repeat protein
MVDRYDQIGRPEKPGMDLAEAEKAIQKAVELDPGNKKYVVDRALVKELDSSGLRYDDPQRLAEAIGLLEGIAADLPGLQMQNVLADALFRGHRFADLKALFDKPEGRGVRQDLKFVAIAGADGSAAAIREARSLSSDSARKSMLQAASRSLVAIGEYSKAADLMEASGDPAMASGVELLRHASVHGQLPLSKDPVIAVVQQYIFALCDHLALPKHEDLLTPEWRMLTFAAQRQQLLSFLGAYRNVAGIALGTRSTADIVVGNVELVKEGSDAIGYRVCFADPASNGAMKTIAWVVRRGDTYKILGLRADVSTGAEALALAKKGDLDAARKWLDWVREEIVPSTNADVLATPLFSRMWIATDSPGKDQILIGAAGMIAGSRYGSEGVDLLRTLRDKARNDSQREAIDQTIGAGLAAQQEKVEEQVSIAESLFKSHPTSAFAINMLGAALINAGNIDGALKLAASATPVDDAGFAAVARVRARAHQSRHAYLEAMEAYRTLSNANKAMPIDWNNLAWLSLFVPGKIAPDVKSAETSVRLTQERNLPSIHTLSAIQAEIGKLKEARAGLLRYLGTSDAINDSAWYVEGRIAESLGLKEAAMEIYSKIARPPRPIGDAAYDLAQVRLGVMRGSSN